ncbi:Zn-ribbon domain-containing OB-fold protein [Paraburkholderia acidisoli]|uniref:Rubredoxin n=1 Tax=Paraburkholderia acidisoli TaxID=2571748 RepID=A0A7Z2GNJ7_9BURK|nr:zinc ribbon domain-containing protein [Paraburkholderia acidisoli]QGZ65008.1 rubredoxin [Paraburkholderia acidisoli]
MSPLEVFRCNACGTTLFPARYFCPSCGGAQFTALAATRGTVVAATAVLHRVGAQASGDLHLASVATDLGPTVIARLDTAIAAGATVALEVDETQRILAHPL